MRAIVLGAGEKEYPPNWELVDVRDDIGHVRNLEDKDWSLPVNYYDLVVAEHIAEHMTDRIRFLRQAIELLKIGGQLIVEVPSHKNARSYHSLEHKSYWGRGIFDGDYVTEQLGIKLESVEFLPGHITGRAGRLMDWLGFASDYRFYLRRVK